MAGRHLVVLGLILLATLGVYAGTLEAPFVYEDANLPPEVPSLTYTTITQNVPGRMLTTLSMLATSHSPAVAHAVNVALHIVAGLLVAWVAFRLTGPVGMCGAALLMFLHPLNGQAVWYVTGRSDLQVTIGVLVAVVAALEGGWLRWPLIAVGLLIAAMSKEIGLVGVPLVVLTLLRWRPLEAQGVPSTALWVAGGAAIGAAWAKVVTWLTLAPGGGGPDVAITEFIVRQIGLAWALLFKVVVPIGFSIDHDALALSQTWLVTSVVATGIVAVVAVWAWRRHPVLAWCVAWIGIALVPRLVVPTNEFLAERHLYLAMVGVAVLQGAVVNRWLRQEPDEEQFWRTVRSFHPWRSRHA